MSKRDGKLIVWDPVRKQFSYVYPPQKRYLGPNYKDSVLYVPPGEGKNRSSSNKTAKRKRRLVQKYGPYCYLCGEEFPLDELIVEHKVPRSRGGPNAFTNLGLACRPCDLEKADRTEEEYRAYVERKRPGEAPPGQEERGA